jgi:hypothetical protein
MSPPQQSHDLRNDKTNALEGTLDAQNPKTMPTRGVLDPEALTSIELSAAHDPITQQKRDDPYLISFDEAHDTEK